MNTIEWQPTTSLSIPNGNLIIAPPNIEKIKEEFRTEIMSEIDKKISDSIKIYPNYNKLLYTEARGVYAHNTDIIPNWESKDTESEKIEIPYDGWLVCRIHVESTHGMSWVNFKLNGRTVMYGDVSSSIRGVEYDQNFTTFVKKGWNYNFWSQQNPNSYYNSIYIYLYDVMN